MLIDYVENLADPLFKLDKLVALTCRLLVLTLDNLAVIKLWVVEHIANFCALQ